MENENNNNFNVTGFPSNDSFEVEIPDTTRRAISRSSRNEAADIMAQLKKSLEGLTSEELKKQIPPEMLAQLQEEADAEGRDLDEALQQGLAIVSQTLSSGIGSSIENLMDNINKSIEELMGSPNEENTENEDESAESKYELSSSDYIHPEAFGSIKCVSSDTLYTDFLDKYGTDSTKYLDENVGITSFIYSDLTVNLTTFPIKSLKYITSTNEFLLFYAEPEEENKYGYFMAVVNDGENFTAFIPEFGNTFNVHGDNEVSLFGPESDPDFFETDNTGNAKFVMLNLNTLLFSTQFYLAPCKNVVLSPKKFGTVKNVIAPVNKPSSMLKVGNIISNESPEAILLKKDADLPLDETVFPLYIHFGTTISEYSLRVIQQILFKVDFNTCQIFDYCELRWTPDGRLYVDIDLGDF